MKPATRKKIEAAIAGGRTFPTIHALMKCAQVSRQTLYDYEYLYGSLSHVIKRPPPTNYRAIIEKAIGKGAESVKDVSELSGVHYATILRHVELNADLRDILAERKEQAFRKSCQKRVDAFESLLEKGYSNAKASKRLMMSARTYYNCCYTLGIEPYAQRQEREYEKIEVSHYNRVISKMLTGRISASA